MRSAEAWVREIRSAGRSLARSPWLTLAAVATIGLGAGPSVMTFAAIRAAASPLMAFEDPDRLIVLSREIDGRSRFPWSYPKFDGLRRQLTSADIAAVAYCPLTVSDAGETRLVVAEATTSNLFSLLRVTPLRGRTFSADEDAGPLGHAVAIVSEPFARRQFGAVDDPVGRALILNGRTFTVIGVVPAIGGTWSTTSGLRPAEVWIPLMMAPIAIPDAAVARRIFQETHVQWFGIVGRIKDGFGIQAVQAEARVAFDRFIQDWPTPGVTSERVEVRTFRAYATDPRLIGNLLVLQAAVALIFAISVFNLAHLVSVRAAERTRDVAVSLALGAHPAHLIGKRLVEAVLLGTTGAALAVTLAWVSRKSLWVLRGLAEPGLMSRDGLESVGVDATVWGGALVLALVASLVSTAVAARQAMPRVIAPVLQAGQVSARAGFRALLPWKPKGLMVTVQVALSIALVAIALFVFQGFSRAASSNPGLHGSVLGVELRAPKGGENAAQEFTKLAVRAGEISGVEGAAVVSCLPASYACPSAGMKREGDSSPPGLVGFHVVSPGSFEALGVRMRAGRDFAPIDTADSVPVAILSETAAAQLPGNPIGQLIRLSGPVLSSHPFEVVGVANHIRYGSPSGGPQPDVYVPYLQVSHGLGFLVVRAAASTASVATTLRERLAGDILLRTAKLDDVGQMVEAEVSRMRLAVALLGGAAGLALLLAGLGLFAVLSRLVQRAVPEIGIRMAMGANRARAAWLVMGAVMRVAGAGSVLGIALAFLLVRHVGGLLGGEVPVDWGAIGTAGLLTACVAVAAGAWPAYRAGQVDPIVALRVD